MFFTIALLGALRLLTLLKLLKLKCAIFVCKFFKFL